MSPTPHVLTTPRAGTTTWVVRVALSIAVLLSCGLVGATAPASASGADPLLPILPPPVVQDVVAAPGNGSATVTWTPSPLASLISSYVVTATPGGASVTVRQPLAGTAVVPGLRNGTSYSFTVTGTNLLGTSAASAPSNAVTPVAAAVLPGRVGDVTATPGLGSARVSWTRLDDPEVTAYTVTASPGGRSVSVTAAAPSAIVPGLTNGTAYSFVVTASNAVGAGPASLPSLPVVPSLGVIPTDPPDPTTPEPTDPSVPEVTGVTATAGDGRAVVAWDAPAGAALFLSGYVVTVSPGARTVPVTGGTTTSTTIQGLDNGTPYVFSVQARRALDGAVGGSSAPSAPTTPAGVPSAPTAVTVTRQGPGSLGVTWGAAGANGSPVTAYDVTVGGRTETVPASARKLVVGGLANGRAYAVSVTATNEVGPGPASATRTATPAAPPATVAKPRAKATGRKIVVTWRAPATRGTPVTGYRVVVNGRARQVAQRRMVLRQARPGRYVIRVAARSGVGRGGLSAPVRVRVRR